MIKKILTGCVGLMKKIFTGCFKIFAVLFLLGMLINIISFIQLANKTNKARNSFHVGDPISKFAAPAEVMPSYLSFKKAGKQYIFISVHHDTCTVYMPKNAGLQEEKETLQLKPQELSRFIDENLNLITDCDELTVGIAGNTFTKGNFSVHYSKDGRITSVGKPMWRD